DALGAVRGVVSVSVPLPGGDRLGRRRVAGGRGAGLAVVRNNLLPDEPLVLEDLDELRRAGEVAFRAEERLLDSREQRILRSGQAGLVDGLKLHGVEAGVDELRNVLRVGGVQDAGGN